jgi:hypothetical protein
MTYAGCSRACHLEDWTQLSGLSHLTLRCVRESHHGTLAVVLPRLTALQSLVLSDNSDQGLPAAGVLAYSNSGPVSQEPKLLLTF